MKSASLKTRYRMQPEKIGKPEPLARRYVGSYSPPVAYKVADIAEAPLARRRPTRNVLR